MPHIVVKLDEADIDAIAHRVASLLSVPALTTESNPPTLQFPGAVGETGSPREPEAPVDPWSAQPAPSVVSAPVQPQPSAPTASPPGDGPPSCAHGPMKYVPPGIYKSGPHTGQPRGYFWACSTPQGAPDKCKSVFPA